MKRKINYHNANYFVQESFTPQNHQTMAPPHTNLKAVNGFLTSRSYLDGYKPTQVDTSYFNAIGRVSQKDGLTHLYRWWLHISSFTEAERAAFPGEPKDLNGGKKAAEDDDDDDDDDDDEDDLFGDDDDDDDEDEDEDPTERLERLAAKGDKVAIAKLKVVRAKAAKAAKKEAAGRTMIVLEIKPFDDQTNLKELEKEIRQIGPDALKGLCLWGAEGECVEGADSAAKLLQ